MRSKRDDILTLTQADIGRAVEVCAGQEIVLRLPEHPATGRRWAFRHHAGVEIMGDENDLTRGTTTKGRSDRVFRLRVLGGDSHISLDCGLAWEPDAPPEATFHLHFRAR